MRCGLLALLIGFTLSLLSTAGDAQTQSVPNPPPNPGLFDAVSGRWAWEGTNCSDNAHTLSFSDDHTRMTYTSAKTYHSATGEDTNVSRYNVLYAEKNRLTMYLEDETRRTQAGDRIVWVLILQDPKTYVWRRTDWGADQSTKKILRCGS